MKLNNGAKTVILLMAVALALSFCSCSSRYHLKRALAKEPELFTEKITLATKIQTVSVPTPEINISASAPVIVGDTFVTVTPQGAKIVQTFKNDPSGDIIAIAEVYVPPDSVSTSIEVPVMEIAPADIVSATQSKWKDGLSKMLIGAGVVSILLLILWRRKKESRE